MSALLVFVLVTFFTGILLGRSLVKHSTHAGGTSRRRYFGSRSGWLETDFADRDELLHGDNGMLEFDTQPSDEDGKSLFSNDGWDESDRDALYGLESAADFRTDFDDIMVNPATGDLMIGGMGGVDTSGHTFGSSD